MNWKMWRKQKVWNKKRRLQAKKIIKKKAECLLHRLEQAAGGIGLYVNANKTEYMSFKQKKIYNLSGKPLRLVY